MKLSLGCLNDQLSWLLGCPHYFQRKTLFELYDRLKLLLQEKPDGNNSGILIEEIVATADNLLEHKCKSMKHYRFLNIEFNILYIFCPINDLTK